MSFNITGLLEPSPLVTVGPTWATNLNTSLTLIDQHDHTSGKGVSLSLGGSNPSGTVVGDVSFTGFGPVSMSYGGFSALGSQPSAGTYNGKLYVYNNNLYFQTINGVNVKITNDTGLSANAATLNNGIDGSGYAIGTTEIKWWTATKTYGFYQDNAATFAAGAFSYLITTPSAAGPVFYAATGGTLATPTGGWLLNNNNYFAVIFDTAGDGSYATTAFRVAPLGARNQYLLGVNGTPTYPITGIYSAADGTVAAPVGALELSAAAGGAVSVGFGPQQLFRAVTTSASPSTFVTQGSIEGFWKTVGANGGLRLRGAATGTSTATAGIEIYNDSGTDYVGINVSPSTAYSLQVGGTAYSSGSFTTGGNLAVTGTGIFGGNVTITTGGVTLTAGDATVSSGNITVTAGSASASEFFPTAAATGPTASKGGAFKGNQVLAFAEVSNGGAVSSNYGIGSTDNFGSTGICTVNLVNGAGGAFSPGNCTAIACLTAGATGTVAVQTVSGSTVVVKTYSDAGSTLANRAFHIMVVGSP